MSDIVWKKLIHPLIRNGYQLSSCGEISFDGQTYKPEYKSSNGYDYGLFVLKSQRHVRLFPMDDLMCYVFIMNNHYDENIQAVHIDGDNRNNNIWNLRVIEDREIWNDLKYPIDIRKGMYEISNHGRVRNKLNGTILTPSKNNHGKYLCVRLMNENTSDTSVTYNIHALVAGSFINKNQADNKNTTINHIDGNGLNNHWKNLEWVSQYENSIHAIVTGLKEVKFSDDQVCYIWDLLGKYDGKVINVFNHIKRMGLLNITYDDIMDIKHKKSYSRITNHLSNYQFRENKIDETVVREICIALIYKNMNTKETYEYILRNGIKNVSYQKISQIKGKHIWKNISDEYF